MMCATALGLGLAAGAPQDVALWVLGAGAGIALLWVLCTAFWPAKADRSCPECGRDSLKRMDPNTTRGLMCTRCEFRDPEATGWFLAEEEGVLDDLLSQDQRPER